MLWITLAAAQELELPNLDTQLVTPSADSVGTVWVEDANVTAGPRLRLVQGYANAPVRYASAGGEVSPVVEHLVTTHLMASYGVGRLRGTVGIPGSTGTIILGQRELGLGDAYGELKVHGFGSDVFAVGALARVSGPTATVPLMGSKGWTYGGWLIATAAAGPVTVAANVGSVGVPTADLGSVVWDDRLSWRAGASAPLGAGGVSLEVGGQALYTQFEQPGALPMEALVGGWYRIGPTRFVARAAVGAGFGQGIGASRYRGVVGIGYEPTGLEDRDRDGILDNRDDCPQVPEDLDLVQDEDGCPDDTIVALDVVDPDGNRLPFAADLDGTLFRDGALTAPQGAYTLTVSADGYDTLVTSFEVPPGQPVDHTVTLGASVGQVRVSVVDPEGEPLDAALVVVDVTTGLAELGEGSMTVPAGEHVLVVETDEYFPARVEFAMPPGGLRHLEIQLEPVIARMTADRIQVDETVLFETGSAEILEASDDLLGQVADLMLIYPDIRIRIEGHTDDVGDAESNRVLSQERAESVRSYLIIMHVPEERLEAVGYGEERPLVDDTSPEARAQNRRVEFVFIDAEEAP